MVFFFFGHAGMWDLNYPRPPSLPTCTGRPVPPAVGAQTLNHQPTRAVPVGMFLEDLQNPA